MVTAFVRFCTQSRSTSGRSSSVAQESQKSEEATCCLIFLTDSLLRLDVFNSGLYRVRFSGFDDERLGLIHCLTVHSGRVFAGVRGR